jgi:hypothetical protein
MPLYEFTFTDTSTHQVLADDPVAAKAHIDELLLAAKYVPNDLKGKALAGTAPRLVDKWKEREALNQAARR